jgi:tetratricopeptide (TPR) repeat protein
MRPHFLLLLFALAVPVLAQQPDPRIQEGIALFDAGKYDEAIARYKAVLADDPSNVLAGYELAYAYQAKGDHAQCRAVVEPLAEKEGRLQPAMLMALGSCLDLGGESDKAVAAYRRGLALAPDHPQILYNLAVTLSSRNEYAEARELLKKEVTLKPRHGSGRYLLAKVFEAESFRSAAILEYLRFLALEPSSPRGKDAAERALALLNLGVEKKGRKDISITVDPDSRIEEGDFKGWEMMLGIVSGGRFLTEKRRQSDFEKTQEQIASALAMLVETAADLSPSYSATQNVPFFAELHKRELLDAFAATALSSLNLKGADKWQKQNAQKVAAFAAFMAEGAR